MTLNEVPRTVSSTPKPTQRKDAGCQMHFEKNLAGDRDAAPGAETQRIGDARPGVEPGARAVAERQRVFSAQRHADRMVSLLGLFPGFFGCGVGDLVAVDLDPDVPLAEFRAN